MGLYIAAGVSLRSLITGNITFPTEGMTGYFHPSTPDQSPAVHCQQFRVVST
jgi:hypothetical protein